MLERVLDEVDYDTSNRLHRQQTAARGIQLEDVAPIGGDENRSQSANADVVGVAVHPERLLGPILCSTILARAGRSAVRDRRCSQQGRHE